MDKSGDGLWSRRVFVFVFLILVFGGGLVWIYYIVFRIIVRCILEGWREFAKFIGCYGCGSLFFFFLFINID